MSSGEADYLALKRGTACTCHEPYEVGSGRRCPVHENQVSAVPVAVDLGEPKGGTYEAVTYFPGERKAFPVFTGAVMYFPHAFAALAHCSHVANEQHNSGEPVHWDRSKSVGDGNEMLRHAMEAAGPNPVDADGEYHDVKAAWRALELVERRIRRQRGLDN